MMKMSNRAEVLKDSAGYGLLLKVEELSHP